MIIHAETTRFYLREFEESDAEHIFALDSNPDVLKFIGTPVLTDIKQAEQILAHILGQYDKYGIGRWCVIDKDSGAFLGWSGLKYETQVRSEFNYYDVGYRLLPRYWGKGVATETAKAAIKFGFDQLDLETISGATEAEHHASIHVLKKCGLKENGTFLFEDAKCNWFTITREEFLKSSDIQ